MSFLSVGPSILFVANKKMCAAQPGRTLLDIMFDKVGQICAMFIYNSRVLTFRIVD